VKSNSCNLNAKIGSSYAYVKKPRAPEKHPKNIFALVNRLQNVTLTYGAPVSNMAA